MERCVTRSVPESYGGRFVMLRRPKVVGSFRSQASIETVLVACLALIARCHYWGLTIAMQYRGFYSRISEDAITEYRARHILQPAIQAVGKCVKMLFLTETMLSNSHLGRCPIGEEHCRFALQCLPIVIEKPKTMPRNSIASGKRVKRPSISASGHGMHFEMDANSLSGDSRKSRSILRTPESEPQ